MSWLGLTHKGVEPLYSEEWNAVVDALDILYGYAAASVKREELTSLKIDIIPAEDNTYSLGSEEKAWASLHAHYGYFKGNVLVQDKPVLKDGDPISVFDILDAAYGKLDALKDDLKASIERLHGKLVEIHEAVQGFRSLDVLAEARYLTVPALYYDLQVLPQTDISRHKLKTLSTKTDGGVVIKVYCYDEVDEFDVGDPYHEETPARNKTSTVSWVEDFFYCKVLADNPEAVDHVIWFVRLKGRGL